MVSNIPVFISNFKNLDFGPFYESLKHEKHQPYGIRFVGFCEKVSVLVAMQLYAIHMLLIAA